MLTQQEYKMAITATGTKSQTYDKKRAQTYPEIGEQLDKLYHDIDGGKLGEDAKTGTWYVAIKDIKDKYPK